DLKQSTSILQTQYGYDPGSFSEISTPINNNKVFLRTDFNVSPRNQLTVRLNYVKGSKQVSSTGVPNSTTYAFPTDFYTSNEKVWSPVAQLNTTAAHVFNEFRDRKSTRLNSSH